MLQVSNLAVSYGAITVLNHIDLTLNPGERVGVVGANGVGKSTLLKAVVGNLSPDSGSVTLQRGVDIGYLPQDDHVPPGKTVQSLLDDALAPVRALADEMRALEAQMAQPDADLDAVFAAYNDATAAFELRGGYEAGARTAQVLDGLGVGHIARGRALVSLSGGERARLGLAAMLVRAPGVLLLDEPTNHLDRAALAWLEDYLAAYRGAVMLVSHDRTFLNRTVNRIIEIDEHTRRATSYAGDYDAYAAEKARRLAQWRADYAAQQDEMHALRRLLKSKRGTSAKRHVKTSDGDKFIKHFKDQTADKTLARDLRSAEERLRRLEADPVPRPPRLLTINPDFDPAELRGHFPLTVSRVSKAYAGRCVLADFSLTVGTGERVAVTGANGAGKSTLLRLIVGVEAPDAGTITLAPSVRLGYLPQTDDLPPGETLIDAYSAGLAGGYEDHKADLISSGFFTYPELRAPVSGMSAGQRRKVQLARLIAARANLLLLDEPTNHLSLDVVEAFEAALDDFTGTVIAVSHDRRFLARFGGRDVALVRAGQTSPQGTDM